MKKESYLLIGGIVIIIILGVLTFYLYSQNKQLNLDMVQLNADKEQLFNEKETILFDLVHDSEIFSLLTEEEKYANFLP